MIYKCILLFIVLYILYICFSKSTKKTKKKQKKIKGGTISEEQKDFLNKHLNDINNTNTYIKKNLYKLDNHIIVLIKNILIDSNLITSEAINILFSSTKTSQDKINFIISFINSEKNISILYTHLKKFINNYFNFIPLCPQFLFYSISGIISFMINEVTKYNALTTQSQKNYSKLINSYLIVFVRNKFLKNIKLNKFQNKIFVEAQQNLSKIKNTKYKTLIGKIFYYLINNKFDSIVNLNISEKIKKAILYNINKNLKSDVKLNQNHNEIKKMVSHFTETYINIFILIIVSLFKTLYNFDYTDYLSYINDPSFSTIFIPRFILDFIKGKNTEILEDKQLEKIVLSKNYISFQEQINEEMQQIETLQNELEIMKKNEKELLNNYKSELDPQKKEILRSNIERLQHDISEIERFELDQKKHIEYLQKRISEIQKRISQIEQETLQEPINKIEQETLQEPINKIEQETLQKPINKIEQETLQKRPDLITTLSGGSQTKNNPIKLLSIIGGSYADINNAVKEMKVKNNNNNTFFSKINSKISSKIDSSIVDYIKFFNNINIKKGGSNLRDNATDLTDDISFMKEYLDKHCTDKKSIELQREAEVWEYQVEQDESFSKLKELNNYMCKKSSFLEDLKNIKNVSNNILNKKITEKSGLIILLEIILIFNIIVLDKKYLPKLLKILNSKKLLFLIRNETSRNIIAFTTLIYNTLIDTYTKLSNNNMLMLYGAFFEIRYYLEYIGMNIDDFLGHEIQELSQLKETDWNNFKQKFNFEEHNVEEHNVKKDDVDTISDTNIDRLEKNISNNKRLLQTCIKVILHFYDLLQKQ